MSLNSYFTDHPATVGETYVEHMGMAGSFSLRLLLAGLACLAHAVFPFLFEKTGGRMITELHDAMVTNRRRHRSAQPAQRTASKA